MLLYRIHTEVTKEREKVTLPYTFSSDRWVAGGQGGRQWGRRRPLRPAGLGLWGFGGWDCGEGSIAGSLRGMAVGGGQPGGGGKLWAARPGGDGAVGRVV